MVWSHLLRSSCQTLQPASQSTRSITATCNRQQSHHRSNIVWYQLKHFKREPASLHGSHLLLSLSCTLQLACRCNTSVKAGTGDMKNPTCQQQRSLIYMVICSGKRYDTHLISRFGVLPDLKQPQLVSSKLSSKAKRATSFFKTNSKKTQCRFSSDMATKISRHRWLCRSHWINRARRCMPLKVIHLLLQLYDICIYSLWPIQKLFSFSNTSHRGRY